MELEGNILANVSVSRFFKFLPGEQRKAFVQEITEQAS